MLDTLQRTFIPIDDWLVMFGRSRTFKERVERFWSWFSDRAPEFFERIEAGNCATLANVTDDHVSEMWSQFQWVYGPGPVGRGGHALTVCGGGNSHAQFLADDWFQAAPELEGWTFYPARQPGALSEDMQFNVDGRAFQILELELAPELDEEREQVHVEVWHPEFQHVPDNVRDMVLFLILDEVLGEFGVGQWLGAIKPVAAAPRNAIPAAQFRDFIHDLEVERGWKKLPPTESYNSYQLPEPSTAFPRADTVVGSTVHMGLIQDFLAERGPLEEDPLAESGAEFVYLEFSSTLLPRGDEAAFRGRVADLVQEHLDRDGRVLGGAIGVDCTYIDVLLTNGKRAYRRMKAAIAESELAGEPVQLRGFSAPQRLRWW